MSHSSLALIYVYMMSRIVKGPLGSQMQKDTQPCQKMSAAVWQVGLYFRLMQYQYDKTHAVITLYETAWLTVDIMYCVLLAEYITSQNISLKVYVGCYIITLYYYYYYYYYSYYDILGIFCTMKHYSGCDVFRM